MQRRYAPAIHHIKDILGVLHDSIPENKRNSFGTVYTVQVLSKYLFFQLLETDVNVFEIGAALFKRSRDFRSKGTALGILSLYGIGDCAKVLRFFEASASSGD